MALEISITMATHLVGWRSVCSGRPALVFELFTLVPVYLVMFPTRSLQADV